MRTPLVTIGGSGSLGTAFLLSVMCALSKDSSASLPVTLRLVKSISIKCESVPPETMRKPASAKTFAIAEMFASTCF